MSYSDQKFYARPCVSLASGSFGTATAASATGINLSSVIYLPQFLQKTNVTKVQLVCTTAIANGSTAVKAHFMNGTATMGTAVLTTATAGQVIITSISTNNTFTASSGMTINLTGTATASGAANGSYIVAVEAQELYS